MYIYMGLTVADDTCTPHNHIFKMCLSALKIYILYILIDYAIAIGTS